MEKKLHLYLKFVLLKRVLVTLSVSIIISIISIVATKCIKARRQLLRVVLSHIFSYLSKIFRNIQKKIFFFKYVSTLETRVWPRR